jgi:protein-ribulosamine 3-kinase
MNEEGGMPDWGKVSQQISAVTGGSFSARQVRSVGGGCINSAYCLEDGDQRFFVKTNSASRLDMFEAEAEGLREIAGSKTIGVPEPVCVGLAGSEAFLAMEYIPLGGGGAGSMERLGRDLAAMHQTTQDRFGWLRDNTIGATPQVNEYCQDWGRFWQRHRLGFQLDLAAQNGAGRSCAALGEQLLARLDGFFSDYTPVPSLLHGDLWSGNYAIAEGGCPVIFDPAVYYGDRETDLAMTELFGGFPERFYAAYNEAHPLDAGYPVRKELYNLYHILNHFNLFGGGYLTQATGMMSRLLSELG